MFQLPGAGDKEVLYGSSYGGENVQCCVALGLPRSIFVPDVKLLFFQKPCRIARMLDFFCEGFSEPQLIITTHKNPNSVLASWCSSSCRKSGGRRRFTVLSLAALGRSHQERAALLPASLAWASCQPLSHAPQAGSPTQRAPRLQQSSSGCKNYFHLPPLQQRVACSEAKSAPSIFCF